MEVWPALLADAARADRNGSGFCFEGVGIFGEK